MNSFMRKQAKEYVYCVRKEICLEIFCQNVQKSQRNFCTK